VSHVPEGVRYHESVLETVGGTPLVRLRVVARHCPPPVPPPLAPKIGPREG